MKAPEIGCTRKRVWPALLLLLVFLFGAALLVWQGTGEAAATQNERYDRLLGQLGYPKDHRLRHFPAQIPEEAQQVQVHYHPAVAQGGEMFALQYEVDAEALAAYEAVFSDSASWIGMPATPEANTLGVHAECLNVFDDDPRGASKDPRGASKDPRVFLLHSRPHRPDDWNHGEVSLVAINAEQNLMLFFYEHW